MKISVLIPVYNAEKYLSRCIESILTQQIYELILVNDGSIDSSASICDMYAKQDIRVKVFHQENRGVSFARNLALENVSGDWIVFVDADDYVENNWLEVLISNIETYESDIYIYGYRQIDTDSIYEFISDKDCMDSKEFIESPFYCHAVWSYVFKLSLIKEQHIIFPVALKYSEDQAFLLKYISLCQNVVFINEILYNYCTNVNSALFQPLNANRIVYNLMAANDFLQFCFDRNIRIDDFEFAIWRLYEDFFLFYPKLNKNYRKECQHLYTVAYKETLMYYPEFRKYSYFKFSSHNLYLMNILRKLPDTIVDMKNYFIRKLKKLKNKIIELILG